MTEDKLKELLKNGEGVEVEFKTSRTQLNKSTFETICAFLNRRGGHLLLGVKDTGVVDGVSKDSIQEINQQPRYQCKQPSKAQPTFLPFKSSNRL